MQNLDNHNAAAEFSLKARLERVRVVDHESVLVFRGEEASEGGEERGGGGERLRRKLRTQRNGMERNGTEPHSRRRKRVHPR